MNKFINNIYYNTAVSNTRCHSIAVFWAALLRRPTVRRTSIGHERSLVAI